jgi:biotin operon repressor
MQEGRLLMTQTDRDRLVALKKAKKKLISQAEAAKELDLSVRQVQRLLGALKDRGDRAVVHGLRGRASNRKIEASIRAEAVKILSGPNYAGFGPTLAAEYLAEKHAIRASKETIRQWMMAAKLWRGRKVKVAEAHLFRRRRSRCGELIQWDTSEHEWLEGRGEKLYLIAMIDDATSRLWARFARHDSTEENMRLLWSYLEKFGRPLMFYTDKASLFQTTEKRKRDEPGVVKDPKEMPPTQIGRALGELAIAWSAAHSPQAKGRVERNFGTAQDRLVKGMRVAGVSTLEAANEYLHNDYLPWWERHMTVEAIGAKAVVPGLRGADVRVEERLDGALALRFGEHYLPIEQCATPKKPKAAARKPAQRNAQPRRGSNWDNDFLFDKGPKLWQAIQSPGYRREKE